MSIILVIISLALMVGILSAVFRKQALPAVSPIVINPCLGFLNLIGETAEYDISEDIKGFGSLFNVKYEWVSEPEECDVLMVYCKLDGSGRINNTWSSLGEIIRRSKASVVVIASNNSPKAYIASGKKEDLGGVNLVMTIERNGSKFPEFFKSLFQKMFNGVSMPLAWVELAPQGPTISHENTPETIFSCGAGKLTFINK